jgi:ABC-type methionine transport system permease subunit|tara:strand:- start:1070 stop:1219 length:150 start_codon:yes stop_codon:yes gene_type:complete
MGKINIEWGEEDKIDEIMDIAILQLTILSKTLEIAGDYITRRLKEESKE